MHFTNEGYQTLSRITLPNENNMLSAGAAADHRLWSSQCRISNTKFDITTEVSERKLKEEDSK